MTTKQRNLSNAAATRKAERAAIHAAMTARHAARREAIAIYEAAMTKWEAERFGPIPCDPRFYDFSLFPENKLEA